MSNSIQASKNVLNANLYVDFFFIFTDAEQFVANWCSFIIYMVYQVIVLSWTLLMSLWKKRRKKAATVIVTKTI